MSTQLFSFSGLIEYVNKAFLMTRV